MPQPLAREIEAATERILAGSAFAVAPRQQAMLRFLVRESLAGRAESIKESVIAIEVFGKDGSFDPRSDSIVRVEARKLRENLERYYQGEGQYESVVVSVPKGGYQPNFVTRDQAAPPLSEGANYPSGSVQLVTRRKRLVAWLTFALIFAVGFTWWFRSRQAVPQPPVNTIAVLPFANMAQGKEDENFADGLTDQLIGDLSQVEGIRVIARTSTFQFRNKAADIREIGKALNAGLVMEGSVRRSGGRVSVTAQMIQTGDGVHLWSRTYEHPSSDAIALQSKIAEDIIRTVRYQRGNQDALALVARYPEAGEAREHYLKGLFAYDSTTKEGIEETMTEYRTALRLAPRYPPALLGMADAYVALGIFGFWRPVDAMPAAEDAARRALAVDSRLGEAYAVLGYKAAVYDWNWKVSQTYFERSIELNPRCSHCRSWYSLYTLAPLGRSTEAWTQLSKSIELDPLEARLQSFRIMVPVILGESDRAIEEGRRFVGQRGDDFLAHLYMSAAFRQKGRYADAAVEGERASQLVGGYPPVALRFRAESLADAGDLAGVRKLSAEIDAVAQKINVGPASLAAFRVLAREYPAAEKLLAQAVDEHDPALIFIRHSFVYSDLKGRPGFDGIWRRIGLPE